MKLPIFLTLDEAKNAKLSDTESVTDITDG